MRAGLEQGRGFPAIAGHTRQTHSTSEMRTPTCPDSLANCSIFVHAQHVFALLMANIISMTIIIFSITSSPWPQHKFLCKYYVDAFLPSLPSSTSSTSLCSVVASSASPPLPPPRPPASSSSSSSPSSFSSSSSSSNSVLNSAWQSSWSST